MWIIKNIILFLLMFPIIGILLLWGLPLKDTNVLKKISLIFSCSAFIISLIIWGGFNKSIGLFQFVNKYYWLQFLTLNFSLGLDGISFFFCIINYIINTFMYFNKLEQCE